MTGNGYPELDPARLMGAIDADARALDTAGKRLGAAITELSGASDAYESALQAELVRIYDAAVADDKRPPAEDLRRAMAHAAVLKSNPKLYGKHLTLQSEVEALKAYIAAKRAAVNARQSLLSALRTEAA